MKGVKELTVYNAAPGVYVFFFFFFFFYGDIRVG